MLGSRALLSGPVAFGPVAESWAKRYAAHVDVVIADSDGAARAVDEAVQRKRAGKTFFVVPIIDDARAILARRLAVRFFRAESAFERRSEYCLELADSPAIAQERLPDKDYDSYPNILRSKAEQLVMRDLLWMGSSLLVRSWAEYERVTQAIDETPLYATRALSPSLEIASPPLRFGAGKHIVIWAPDSDASDLLIEAFGLQDAPLPVYVVCQNAGAVAELGLRAVFIAPDAAASLLKEAAAVVVSELSDPAPALALARRGLRMAIACSSGAEEYINGAHVYFPWDSRSVRDAILAAMNSAPPRVRDGVPIDVDYASELASTEPALPPTTPVAFVYLPTKNRRELLPRALDSVAAQTYPNVELMIVNDGGDSIADIASRYANARLLEHPTSAGVIQRVNEATEACSGKYCVLLSDDDYFFPDHIARCVYALERTGLSAVRYMLLVTLLEPGNDGYYEIPGYLLHERYAYDPTELLWANNIGHLVYRHSAMTELGLRDDASGHAGDWDYFMMFAKAGDFACVKAATYNLDQRNDQTNMNDSGFEAWEAGVRKVYERYPVQGRPYIEEQRAEVLARVLDRDPNRLRPMRAPRPLEPPRRGEYAVFRQPG